MKHHTFLHRAWRSLRQNMPLWIGGAMLLALVVVALVAPLLGLRDPDAMLLPSGTLKIPSPPGVEGLLLGSDMLGRDLWSRLVFGIRYTFLFAGIAATIRLLFGATLGIIAGWYPRLAVAVDVLTTTFSAIPSLFFAIGIVLIFFRGANLTTSTVIYLLAVSLTGWTATVVRCRAAVQNLAAAPFIEAAYVIGLRRRAVLWRHVVVNLRGLLAVEMSYAMASVLLLIAELGFLGLYLGTPEIGLKPDGLSADPVYAEWGSLLALGLRTRANGWWLLIFPLLAVGYAIFAFNLLAEGLRRR